MKEIYGLSRNQDKKGKVVKRNLNPYVNCIHTLVGTARDNMEIYVIEVYGIIEDTASNEAGVH